MAMTDWRKRFQRVPFFGHLARGHWEQHREALKQFGFILVLSLSPIFLSVLLDVLKNADMPQSISAVVNMVWKNFRQGELLIDLSP
jgi:hypothetical protein